MAVLLTTCGRQSKRPEIRETGTPLGVSNKVGDLSPLVYIRKRACGAFFGMHAFGAAFWLRPENPLMPIDPKPRPRLADALALSSLRAHATTARHEVRHGLRR